MGKSKSKLDKMSETKSPVVQEPQTFKCNIVMGGRGLNETTGNYERIANGFSDKGQAFALRQKITTAIKKSQKGIRVRDDFEMIALEKNAICISVTGQVDGSNNTTYRVYIAADGRSQTKRNEYLLAVEACENEIHSLWRLQSQYFDQPQQKEQKESRLARLDHLAKELVGCYRRRSFG